MFFIWYFLASVIFFFCIVGFYAYIRGMKTTNEIITLLNSSQQIWTAQKYMELVRLGHKLTAETNSPIDVINTIEVLDEYFELNKKTWKFEYIINAYVLYLGQILEVHVIGKLDVMLYEDDDISLKHHVFDDVLLNLPGDVDTKYPIYEKPLADFVTSFFSKKDIKAILAK